MRSFYKFLLLMIWSLLGFPGVEPSAPVPRHLALSPEHYSVTVIQDPYSSTLHVADLSACAFLDPCWHRHVAALPLSPADRSPLSAPAFLVPVFATELDNVLAVFILPPHHADKPPWMVQCPHLYFLSPQYLPRKQNVSPDHQAYLYLGANSCLRFCLPAYYGYYASHPTSPWWVLLLRLSTSDSLFFSPPAAVCPVHTRSPSYAPVSVTCPDVVFPLPLPRPPGHSASSRKRQALQQLLKPSAGFPPPLRTHFRFLNLYPITSQPLVSPMSQSSSSSSKRTSRASRGHQRGGARRQVLFKPQPHNTQVHSDPVPLPAPPSADSFFDPHQHLYSMSLTFPWPGCCSLDNPRHSPTISR